MTATMLHFPASPSRPAREAIQINVHARVESILAAANSLLRDGYTIVDFMGNALSPKATIWLMPEPRLASLVERDLAGYYYLGHDNDGPYRIGQFDRLGVAVKWIERLVGGRK